MTSTYGTRRSSALQQLHGSNTTASTSTQPTAIPGSRSSSLANLSHYDSSTTTRNHGHSKSSYDISSSPLLSSSAGKLKRPSTLKARRLSTSQSLRPPSTTDVGTARSLPAQLTINTAHHPDRRNSSRNVSSGGHYGAKKNASAHALAAAHQAAAAAAAQFVLDDDDDDGEIKPGSKHVLKGGTIFQCEICSKLYKHSACLQKHRWEHTEQWQEASKLLLSKHQQVQLLEAAAILQVASAGASLPQDKAYWPAAVSPPSAGLLGSSNFSLQSPRMFQSLSLHSDDTPYGSQAPSNLRSSKSPPPSESNLGDSGSESDDESASEDEEDDDDDEDDDGVDEVDDGMFDLDLGGGMDGIENESAPIGSTTRPSNTTTNGNGNGFSVAGRKSSEIVGATGMGENLTMRDSGFGSLGTDDGSIVTTRMSSAIRGS